MTAPEVVTLWRPVGPEELKLIEETDWKAFPPRLSEQPIFYPVTTEEYAEKMRATGMSGRADRAMSHGSKFVRTTWTNTRSSSQVAKRTRNTGFQPRSWASSMTRLSVELKL